MLFPASGFGKGLNNISVETVTALQVPFPVLVRATVTIPAVLSFASPKYCVDRLVSSLNIPVPIELQVAPDALVTVPSKSIRIFSNPNEFWYDRYQGDLSR